MPARALTALQHRHPLLSMPPPQNQPSVRHAVAYSLSQSGIAFVVSLVTSMIVARLLTPKETGVFALAAAAVAVGGFLREFGLGDYLISQKTVTPQKLRVAFTLNLAIGWSVAALLWLLAEPLARWYAEPSLTRVVHVLCVNFVLVPFGITAVAMLSKAMRFGRIFVLQTTSLLVGAIVTVWGALAGHSSLSLALGSAASSLTVVLMLLLLQPGTVFHRPTLQGLREALRFGGALTLTRLLDSVTKNSSDFIVSANLGFSAGGLWSKSSSLVGSFHDFFLTAVSRVATPAFTRARQQALGIREPYLHATVLVATAQWSFFALLVVFADEVVHLLFGPSWLACVPVLQILAIGAMLWAPVSLSFSALTSRQAVRQQLQIQLLYTPLAVLGLLVGAAHSLEAMAGLFSAARLLRLLHTGRAMQQVFGISLADVAARLDVSAAVVVTAATVGAIVKATLLAQGLAPWQVLAGGVAAALVVGVGVSLHLKHPLVIEAKRLLRRRFGLGAPANTVSASGG